MIMKVERIPENKLFIKRKKDKYSHETEWVEVKSVNLGSKADPNKEVLDIRIVPENISITEILD